MMDRAYQALHLLGLDPIAEATADPHSYGFRTCRRAADAMEFIHGRLSCRSSPKWVLEGDIKACFDEIDHTWLEKNIPMDKKTLKGWLKAGFMKGKTIFPTKSGTPQGGIISPVLANMALDGLQEKLRNTFAIPDKKGAVRPKVYLCRYADDFIISGITRELLENEVKPLVKQFLSERGLKLSPEKTLITNVSEGFDFLGQNVRKYGDKMLTKPSKKSVQNLKESLRGAIKRYWSRPLEMITKVNSILRGWGYYHRHIVSKETF